MAATTMFICSSSYYSRETILRPYQDHIILKSFAHCDYYNNFQCPDGLHIKGLIKATLLLKTTTISNVFILVNADLVEGRYARRQDEESNFH